MADGDRIVSGQWVVERPQGDGSELLNRMWDGRVEGDLQKREWHGRHCGDVIEAMNKDLGERPEAEYQIRE